MGVTSSPAPSLSLCLPQVRLNPTEASDVLKRWAEYLCSPQVNQKSKAILVLLSLGCFQKVGEMLHRSAARSHFPVFRIRPKRLVTEGLLGRHRNKSKNKNKKGIKCRQTDKNGQPGHVWEQAWVS